MCLMQMAFLKGTGNKKGFTLVELVVVIAVIGILATISVLGFSKYQSDARDARRDASTHAIAEALEKYYDQNGEYPSCTQLTGNAVTVAHDTLSNLDEKTMIAPAAADGQLNSIKCTSSGNVLTPNGSDFFEYQGDGSSDCANDGSCLYFTLKYKSESDGTIKTVQSRRKASLATSGNLVLTSNYVSFTSATVEWTHIQNTASYTLQRATNAAFTSNLVETATTAEALNVTGLAKNTEYFFRVRAASANGETTSWSNVLDITTLDLNSPSITSIVATTTSLKPNWTSVDNANAYRLQYSASSSFPSGSTTTVDNIAGTTQLITGLDQGRLLYFRVYPLSGTNVGSPSSPSSANTTITTPSKPVMATPTNADNSTYYTTTFGWSAGSTCPANTTMQYQDRYSYNTSAGYTSAWYTASTKVSHAYYTYEGYKYTAEVQARCRSNSTTTIVSGWSAASSASYTQAVTGPKAVSWTAERDGNNRINMFTQSTCRSSATPYGSIDPYARNLEWTTGPNTGNTGWRVPGGYSYTGQWYPSSGVYNTAGNIQNGWFFTARALIYCRNSDTGAQSSASVSTQASGWTWGSNI